MTIITTDNYHQFVSPVRSLPGVSRDTNDLGSGAHVIYKCDDYNCQVLPGRVVEAYSDEYVELFCSIQCERAFELIRKPPSSKTELKGVRLPFDVPGLYTVRITLARAWSQDIRIACFPRAAEQFLGYQERAQAAQRRARLRQICRDDRLTDATVIDSLESDDPMFGLGGRIVGAGRPLEQGSGAGGHQAFSVSQYNT